MARDPHVQREDERAREDADDDRRQLRERAERAIEKGDLEQHLEVLADALMAPGNRIYECPNGHEEARIVVPPVMLGGRRAFMYPIGDGPYCAVCRFALRIVSGEVVK